MVFKMLSVDTGERFVEIVQRICEEALRTWHREERLATTQGPYWLIVWWSMVDGQGAGPDRLIKEKISSRFAITLLTTPSRPCSRPENSTFAKEVNRQFNPKSCRYRKKGSYQRRPSCYCESWLVVVGRWWLVVRDRETRKESGWNLQPHKFLRSIRIISRAPTGTSKTFSDHLPERDSAEQNPANVFGPLSTHS
ncbi:hypothetical protein E6O75_ATG10260 [Venturia nashicola]|uniref:Uncharacterized protein n=1 Tax=Venturia nashicola TaxID=86259 RepID=A0A4Z1NCQ0_9PEZI|nr:hypothetical protein E6O75_ATG10260 [Venturia nashicola]